MKMYWYMAGSFVIIFGWLLLTTYWTLRPYELFTFVGDKTEVVHKMLRPGDPLLLRGNVVQNYKGIHCTASRTLEDGITFTYTPTEFVTTGGRQTSTSAVVEIPTFVSSGTYRLKNVFICQMNPIRKITITRYSEDFHVIDNTGHE